MSEPIPLAAGGQVLMLSGNERDVTLEVEFAAPPGSSIDLLVCGSKLSVKVRACRRVNATDPARFCVEARFVNLSREQRNALKFK
jgi:hypothetical protein